MGKMLLLGVKKKLKTFDGLSNLGVLTVWKQNLLKIPTRMVLSMIYTLKLEHYS